MRVILLGPPGAGKGTQATFISDKYSIPHISTGDMFRKNISGRTLLGVEAKKYIDKGLLVPDSLTIDLVKDKLEQKDCENGFLLDGFPRTVSQAEALDQFLKDNGKELDCVLLIDVPNDFILERITGRRVCESCGASYHMKFNPPKDDERCNICGNSVIQRKDDTEATVVERLKVYTNQTQPLIEYYKGKKILASVDGRKSIEEVMEHVCSVLEGAINYDNNKK